MHRRGSRMGQPNPPRIPQNSTKSHKILNRFTIVYRIPQNSTKFHEISQLSHETESSETTQECISLRLQGGDRNSQQGGLEELVFMHARFSFRRWRARKFDTRRLACEEVGLVVRCKVSGHHARAFTTYSTLSRSL